MVTNNSCGFGTGTAGQVLTSNGAGVAPTFQAATGGGITGTTTQYAVIVGAGSSSVGSVGPGSAGQILQSGGAAANPSYSTATYPTTTTANQILFSNATNTVTGISTANSGVLSTSSAGVPSIDTTNFAVLSTGLQLKGNNANTAPPAGFIGEQLTTGYVSGIALTTATAFNLGSLSVTAGIWMFYAFIVYSTTSSVSGNTDWFCSFNTTSATLPGAGLQQVDIGTVTPRNGGNNITISHSFYNKVASTTTWYCVGQGSGSSVFNSVTGNGAFWAVRVG